MVREGREGELCSCKFSFKNALVKVNHFRVLISVFFNRQNCEIKLKRYIYGTNQIHQPTNQGC